MSKEKNQQYKKSVKFDKKEYWIFDIKQAAKDLGFDIEKITLFFEFFLKTL